MKIRFKSGDDLALREILNIPSIIIVVRCVFQGDNQYYPQVYLHECAYEFVNEL